jgi:hypothetical protein
MCGLCEQEAGQSWGYTVWSLLKDITGARISQSVGLLQHCAGYSSPCGLVPGTDCITTMLCLPGQNKLCLPAGLGASLIGGRLIGWATGQWAMQNGKCPM